MNSMQTKWATVKPLYSKLHTLCLPEMTTLELAKYKISNSLYPTKIHDLADSNGGLKQHRYPTQFKNTPNIQKHSTTEFNNSHLCKGLAVYNKLPNRLKCLQSLRIFTREMKKYLLSQY